MVVRDQQPDRADAPAAARGRSPRSPYRRLARTRSAASRRAPRSAAASRPGRSRRHSDAVRRGRVEARCRRRGRPRRPPSPCTTASHRRGSPARTSPRWRAPPGSRGAGRPRPRVSSSVACRWSPVVRRFRAEPTSVVRRRRSPRSRSPPARAVDGGRATERRASVRLSRARPTAAWTCRRQSRGVLGRLQLGDDPCQALRERVVDLAGHPMPLVVHAGFARLGQELVVQDRVLGHGHLEATVGLGQRVEPPPGAAG